MDNWERFDEKSLPDKRKKLYSSLNMKDIPHVDYKQAKRVYKEFKRKSLSVYHDLYIQSDALLLADVFENVRNMFLKIYELDPAFFNQNPD